MAHTFEYSAPNWWNCLGMIRKYGLDGEGVSLGSRLQRTRTIPSAPSSLLILSDQDVSSQWFLLP